MEGNRDVATGDYITAEVCLCKGDEVVDVFFLTASRTIVSKLWHQGQTAQGRAEEDCPVPGLPHVDIFMFNCYYSCVKDHSKAFSRSRICKFQ